MASHRVGSRFFLLIGGLLAASRGFAAPIAPVVLWQEDTYFDGLVSEQTHGRAARMSADPNLLPVLKNVAGQVAQQVFNLQQVETYTKVQQNNLRFAFNERDPSASIAIIQENLETLEKGTSQIHSNLLYLATRCRMAASQSLPDPQLTKIAVVLIRQIQAAQLELNALYGDATVLESQIDARTQPRDSFLRQRAHRLTRSIRLTQSSIFAIYNSAYEIYLRSRET